MSNEQRKVDLQKFKDSQNLNDKSKLLRVAFAVHNRHMSSGAIKEVINSKPNIESFETFKEIIDELQFELVEFQISKKIESSAIDNLVCFFDEGSFATVTVKGAEKLTLSFSGKHKVEINQRTIDRVKNSF